MEASLAPSLTSSHLMSACTCRAKMISCSGSSSLTRPMLLKYEATTSSLFQSDEALPEVVRRVGEREPATATASSTPSSTADIIASVATARSVRSEFASLLPSLTVLRDDERGSERGLPAPLPPAPASPRLPLPLPLAADADADADAEVALLFAVLVFVFRAVLFGPLRFAALVGGCCVRRDDDDDDGDESSEGLDGVDA